MFPPIAVAEASNPLAGVLFVLAVPLAMLVYLRVARLLRERVWRDAARELGVEATLGRTRALRGVVEGRRVDVLWARRSGLSHNQAGQGTSALHSGIRFTVRHDDLARGLSVHGSAGLERQAEPSRADGITGRDREALERLFAVLPRAEVDDTGVRLARGRDDLSAAQMVATVEAMVRASRELAG